MIILFSDFKSEAKILQKDLLKAFKKVLLSGWYILGVEVERFEKNLADYLGVRYCIGVANGMEALQISLMSLGIGVGDEVITTPISAVATTLAILAVGAKPIFVDVDPRGLLDVTKIEAVISKRTKAILPVHLFGQPVDLKILKSLCKKYHLFLIEDAAQAHGAIFSGKKVGTLGDLGCFSFYPTKNLGAMGDAGAIVTNNSKLAKIAAQIRNYGESSKYKHLRYGLNSRLDELQAAFLSEKLKYLDENNAKRRKLAKRYIKNLDQIEGISVVTTDMERSNFHLLVIRHKKRDQLRDFLARNNIQTLIHYPSIIPDQPFLKGNKAQALPAGRQGTSDTLVNARQMVKEVLSLPCHPYMKLETVDFICEKIKRF